MYWAKATICMLFFLLLLGFLVVRSPAISGICRIYLAEGLSLLQKRLTRRSVMNVKKHLSLLGLKAADKVTGFKGIVESISFDLYGCVQCVLKPAVNEKGELVDGRWFDVARIKIEDRSPVMDLPNFEYGVQAEGKQGASEKPMFGG